MENLFLARFKLKKYNLPHKGAFPNSHISKKTELSSVEKFTNVRANSETEVVEKLNKFYTKDNTEFKEHEVIIIDIEPTIE